MKLNIKGNVGKQEILEALASTLNSLEEIGVEEFKGVNIYFNAYLDGKKVIPFIGTTELDGFEHKSIQKHISFETNASGEKIAKFDKGVKGKSMELNNIIEHYTRINLITEKSIKDAETKENEARLAEQARLKNEHEEWLRQRREQEKIDSKNANECILAIRRLLDLSDEEFRKARSSSSWLKTRKGIEKYTLDDIGEKVYRISMKAEEGQLKKMYLLSEDAKLMYEGFFK